MHLIERVDTIWYHMLCSADDMTDVAAAAEEAEPLPEAGGQLPERQVWLQIALECLAASQLSRESP
jgi:hypothetical protein